MVSTRFLSFGVQGKLKLLLSFGFIVSLRFYFVYVLASIRRKFEICKLIKLNLKNFPSKKFEFSYLLVLLSFTLHFFCIPCSSIRGYISSEMV